MKKKLIKVCPDCKQEINPEWESCYEDDWCPACGLNIDAVKKEKGLINNKDLTEVDLNGGGEIEMTWKMPEWMEKYCVGEYLIYDKQQIETHMNAGSNVNTFNNAPLALMVMGTKSKVELLEKLHSEGLLCEKSSS